MSIMGKIKGMTSFIIATLLALVMLYCVSLMQTFKRVHAKELKRRAKTGEATAEALYKPLSYGLSLDILLWLIILISAAVSFLVYASLSDNLLAFIFIVAILALAFWWLPAAKGGAFRLKLARWSSPYLARLLHYIYPVLKPLDNLIASHLPMHLHSGLYEKADLLDLLAWQAKQSDNRIAPEELVAAEHALKFNDKTVGEIMTPRPKVRMVSADDTVGPILMDDLHGSGQRFFPVYEGKKSQLVGVVYSDNLLKARAGGSVSRYMQTDVLFLHEDYSLYRALQVLVNHDSQLFMVIDSQAKFLGIVTAQAILEQVLGELPADDSMAYDQAAAVASSLTPIEPTKEDDSAAPEVV